MKKSLLSIITITTISIAATAQNVNIPDANFKAYLVGNDAIDTNLDDEIQVSEAIAFTGVISCTGLGINDMTGLEAFVAIQALICSQNNLTALNVSQNTSLLYIDCSTNNISSLDVSQCSIMNTLTCDGNALTSIDVTQNASLSALSCGSMNLGSLNLSQNPNLTILSCYDSGLNTLNLTNNPLLNTLGCVFNNLTSLDLSNNTNLTSIECGGNSIEYLDLSNNTSLSSCFVNDNALTSLNLKNLSTSTLTSFNSTGNPNLACIEVDDVADATANWTAIDATSSFNLDCIILVNSITVSGQAGATLITTNGGTLQMIADVLPANADDATYTWSVTNGTGSASIDASGLLTASSNGTVTVTATANDASGITGSTVITISNQSSAGINDQAALNNLTIYPNPAKTSISIESSEEVESIVFINLTGETVKTIVSPANAIDISDLANGIYILRVQFKTGFVNSKLIKE